MCQLWSTPNLFCLNHDSEFTYKAILFGWMQAPISVLFLSTVIFTGFQTIVWSLTFSCAELTIMEDLQTPIITVGQGTC